MTSSYVVERTLGAGAMGEVYLAREKQRDRLVALKLLSGTLVDASLRARFRREIVLLSSLQHPRLVQIYDHGEHEGRPYFAMEYVEGSTLAGLISTDPTGTREAADSLLEQLLEGVAYLHGAGVLHRDIKPLNILVDSNGLVKLADFGLARRQGANVTAITNAGTVLGTAAFLAPEILTGDEYSPASDVWAVGCVYYQMLTGRLPFAGMTIATLCSEILTKEPLPIPELPGHERRAELIARLLAKDQRKRLRDGGAALAAFQEMGVERVPTPRGVPPPRLASDVTTSLVFEPDVGRGSRRRWAPAALLAAVLGLGVHAARRPPPAAPAALPTITASPSAGHPEVDRLERALFRFRAPQLLRQICEEPLQAPAGTGLRKAREAMLARWAATIRDAVARSDLVATFLVTPPVFSEIAGGSPRGAALFEAISRFEELRNILEELRVPVELPAPRGYPFDLVPVHEPVSAVEQVTVVSDRAMTPAVPATTRRRVVHVAEDWSFRFWEAPAIPRHVERRPIPASHSAYSHPDPLPLSDPLPGQEVVVRLQVEFFGPGETLAVRFRGDASRSPWFAINGRGADEVFHRIPAEFLKGRTRLDMEYRCCKQVRSPGNFHVGTFSVMFLEPRTSRPAVPSR